MILIGMMFSVDGKIWVVYDPDYEKDEYRAISPIECTKRTFKSYELKNCEIGHNWALANFLDMCECTAKVVEKLGAPVGYRVVHYERFGRPEEDDDEPYLYSTGDVIASKADPSDWRIVIATKGRECAYFVADQNGCSYLLDKHFVESHYSRAKKRGDIYGKEVHH